MKSVTIKDHNGKILVKVKQLKNGVEYESIVANDLVGKISVDARTDENTKVIFHKPRVKNDTRN